MIAVVARLRRGASWPRIAAITAVLATAGLVGVFVRAGGGPLPDVPMADVTRGEFVNAIEIRGEIRPLKSVVLTSPLNSGELQIVKLAKNGAVVQKGEVVVQFDGSALQRQVQSLESERKQAEAEIEQVLGQRKLVEEQSATALMRAKYDVERAKLDVRQGDLVSRIQLEQAKLVLADAEQKLREMEEKIRSDKTATEADLFARRRRRDKVVADLERARVGLENLEMKAPTAGTVNLLPNYRSSTSVFGGDQEFRQGDRAWPGAAILQLPDLSSVHLEARLDESDRGQLRPGQEAVVRIEAVPGREFKARIENISLLARPDFNAGWPPPKNFDLDLVLLEIDSKIRPGMTAVARIATERVPGVTLVPADAIFQRDGAPIVYRLAGTRFEERRIEVTRRGREQAIVSGVAPGDRVATKRPAAEFVRRPS
jgi:multidrug efflux pump subunit AcrA (membrane-fusion protein)